MTMSARENMTLLEFSPFRRLLTINRARERREVEHWFGDLDIRPLDGTERALETFSGGNQQKILFAKWLRRKPMAFLLDEPTQGVDIGAKQQLHDRLRTTADDGAAVIVSSTDLEELALLCTRVAVMRNGAIVDEIDRADISVEELTRRVTAEIGREE
jgi:ribose transport system ATP-binding protein